VEDGLVKIGTVLIALALAGTARALAQNVNENTQRRGYFGMTLSCSECYVQRPRAGRVPSGRGLSVTRGARSRQGRSGRHLVAAEGSIS
jgi:hypothetical protein